MRLNLDSLKQAGAFTGRPVRKETTWKQGDKKITAAVYIRPMGYHDAVSNVLSAVEKIDGIAGRVAASICDGNDVPVFIIADIIGEADPERGALGSTLTVTLLIAAQQASDLGKTNSAQMTNSGVD